MNFFRIVVFPMSGSPNTSSDGIRVRLALADPCLPFDPRGATAPDSVPPARGGGAGLALVRAWCNIVAYDRIGAENRLSLELAVD